MTRGVIGRWMASSKRAMYRDGRPSGPMRVLHGLDRFAYGRWFAPRHVGILTTSGRTTGHARSVPIAIASIDDRDHVVSMLGDQAAWVRNVRASNGAARLRRRGRDRTVTLEELPVGERAEILRAYVAVAPAARPHLGVQPWDPAEAFERIAPAHPVFRIREERHHPQRNV